MDIKFNVYNYIMHSLVPQCMSNDLVSTNCQHLRTFFTSQPGESRRYIDSPEVIMTHSNAQGTSPGLYRDQAFNLAALFLGLEAGIQF